MLKYMKLCSGVNEKNKNEIQQILGQEKIPYKIKPKMISNMHIIDSAILGNLDNNHPKISYSIFVKKEYEEIARHLIKFK